MSGTRVLTRRRKSKGKEERRDLCSTGYCAA